MINITKQSGQESAYITEYIADTEADIVDLPKDAVPGSTCLVIETGTVYMLNGKKEWKKL